MPAARVIRLLPQVGRARPHLTYLTYAQRFAYGATGPPFTTGIQIRFELPLASR
jgi:hypothetical protein